MLMELQVLFPWCFILLQMKVNSHLLVNGGAQGDGGDATLVGEAQQPAEIVRDEEFTHQDVLSKKGPSTQLLPDEMVPLILEKPAELFPSDDEGNFGGGDGYNDMDIEQCGPPPHPVSCITVL